MRRLLAFVLAALLALPTLCVPANAGEKTSGKKLKVGTMALPLGLPVRRAEKAGYFKNAGLDVEIIIFASGAPINEAMSAGQMDVAVSGMASVFGLATGQFKYIGEGVITRAGQAVYARPDSPFAKAPRKKSDLYGDPELIRDADVLGPLATSAHFHAIKYAEAFGLTADDFNMVAMDHPQALQAFLSGQGDLLACVSPFSNVIGQQGYFRVSDLGLGLGINLTDTVFVQADALRDRRADLVAFLDCFYRAAADLNQDPDLRRKLGIEWYGEEGRKVTDAEMDDEIAQTFYSTLDRMLTDEQPFGVIMTTIGAFFVEQGMIQEDNYPNIEAGFDDSLIRELKAKYGK